MDLNRWASNDNSNDPGGPTIFSAVYIFFPFVVIRKDKLAQASSGKRTKTLAGMVGLSLHRIDTLSIGIPHLCSCRLVMRQWQEAFYHRAGEFSLVYDT